MHSCCGKQNLFKRRLFLLSAFFSAILSPIALIFCIGWIASKSPFFISGESIKIYTLAIFGILPDSSCSVFSHPQSTPLSCIKYPDLYWLDNTTVFSFALMSISLFAFVAYETYKVYCSFLCAFVSQSIICRKWISLCSVQLEGDSNHFWRDTSSTERRMESPQGP